MIYCNYIVKHIAAKMIKIKKFRIKINILNLIKEINKKKKIKKMMNYSKQLNNMNYPYFHLQIKLMIRDKRKQFN